MKFKQTENTLIIHTSKGGEHSKLRKKRSGSAVRRVLLSACLALAMIPASMTTAFAAPDDNTVYSFTIPGYEKTIYYVVNPSNPALEDAAEYAHAHITAGGGSVDAPRIGATNVYYYIQGVTSASKSQQSNLGTFYGSSKMSWLEYWQNEGLTPSTLTEQGSDVPDGESGGHAGSLAGGGYLDLGGFDAVARPTVTYGISHFSYQYTQIFNGVKGTLSGDEVVASAFEPDDPLVENQSHYARRTPAIDPSVGGDTLVDEVTSWRAASSGVGGLYQTSNALAPAIDTFWMENYRVTGFQRIPVKVDGETYIEQMVLNEAQSSAAKASFKNFTIGGTDGAGKTVTATTGGLKTLSADGSYSAQTVGTNDSSHNYGVMAGSTNVNFIGGQWGDYADVYVTIDPVGAELDANELVAMRNDYNTKLLGAKYEFYGETITDTNGNAIAKDNVTVASVASKTPLATYGTKTGADFWYRPGNRAHRIELGFNFDALRFGGDGTSTTVGDIYNKGNAEGKTGWYKITMYAAGYNNIETMAYISKQVLAPALSVSMDDDKLYLVGLEPALKAELGAGTATIRLVQPGGRNTPEVELANLTNKYSATDGTLDISDLDIASLDSDASYSLSIVAESLAPLQIAWSVPVANSTISVSQSTLEISAGASAAATLTATATPAPTSQEPIVWAVADSGIATVTAMGRVTGVASGTTTVYATANGRTAACTVTVLPTGTGALSRHAGASRVETAIKASVAAFSNPAEVDAVIVAFSMDYPDALAASTLAGCVNGPILLTPTNDIDAATLSEIQRLSPSKVYIVGGTSVVSDTVKQKITALSFHPTVERLGGGDRYATAHLIADKAVQLGARTDEMYLATGRGFADALAVSSFAVSQKVPILLTDPTNLSTETAAYIQARKPARVFVIGGTSVVSANVASAVVGNGAVATERLAGGDRYLTAQAVVNRMIPYYSLQPTVLGIATGAGFADALSGGAALGTRGGVLLLTRPDALVPSAADAINLAKQYKPSVEILGGTSAISAQVENSVRSALI